MAGRVRRFERNESVRHQEFGRTRDSHGVSPSRELRESHTAPSGLPATRSGDAYSTLGRVKFGELQKKNGKKIKEKAKRIVDEDGEEGFSFDLSEFFPRVRTVGIEMKIMTKDFYRCRFGGSFKTNWNAPETASQYLEIHWNNFVNQRE